MSWHEHLGNFRPLSFSAYKGHISKYYNSTTPKWVHTTMVLTYETTQDPNSGGWGPCYALYIHFYITKKMKAIKDFNYIRR